MSSIRRVREVTLTPVGVVATALLLTIVFLCVFAPAIWGHAAGAVNVAIASKAPSTMHWLGTDRLGRDIFARVLVATRPSVTLAALAIGLAAAVGVPLGAIPALLGDRPRRLLGAVINIMVAFPAVLLAMFTDIVVGIGARGAVLGIGIAAAPVFARLAQTLIASIAASDYVAASRMLGASRRRLLMRHLLPNIAEPLILNVTISVGGALLALSALSFLGLGVRPPGYDWGQLVNAGLNQIYEAPATALGPAVAIVAAGVGFSLAGEVIARYVAQAPVTRRSDRRAARSGRDSETCERARLVATDPVLRVRDLQITFRSGTTIVEPVRGVSFDIGHGEIVGIVGESGSGKTLTALAIADLLSDSVNAVATQIEFHGRPLRHLASSDKGRLLGTSMALIYQNPMSSMNPVLRVGRQLSEAARTHGGLARSAAYDRAAEQLRVVRIPNARLRLRQYPHQFSGGMRQRAMLAMGMMTEPSLILADEPTTALDVTVQQQVLRLLREVSTQTGAAILFISHDLAVVSQICERVLVMYAGRVVEEMSVDGLRGRAAHPYTRALLASWPTMATPREQPLVAIPGQPPLPGRLPTGCPFAPRCSYATDDCYKDEPALQSLSAGGAQHRVACFHPVTLMAQTA